MATDTKPAEGATELPQATSADNCGFGIEGVPPGLRHSWAWVWNGPVWTNVARCTACNAERIPTAGERGVT